MLRVCPELVLSEPKFVTYEELDRKMNVPLLEPEFYGIVTF